MDGHGPWQRPVPGPDPLTDRGQGIVTPDAVGLDLEVATVGSRGAAYLLDAAILVLVLALLGVARSVLGSAGFVPGWFGIAMLLVLAFLWQFGYPVGFEVLRHGRTPGKSIMGLRVVTVEGGPVGVRHAVIRASVGILELLGTAGALAVLSSFASRRGQRLGDLAAGTLVVRERRGGAPVAQVFAVPAALEAYTDRLDVSGLEPVDYATVRATLLRADELPPEVRDQIAGQVAARLVPRIRPVPPEGCSSLDLLRCIAVAVQRQRSRTVPSTRAGPPARPTPPDGSPPADRPPPTADRSPPAADPPPAGERAERAGAPPGGFAPPG